MPPAWGAETYARCSLSVTNFLTPGRGRPAENALAHFHLTDGLGKTSSIDARSPSKARPVRRTPSLRTGITCTGDPRTRRGNQSGRPPRPCHRRVRIELAPVLGTRRFSRRRAAAQVPLDGALPDARVLHAGTPTPTSRTTRRTIVSSASLGTLVAGGPIATPLLSDWPLPSRGPAAPCLGESCRRLAEVLMVPCRCHPTGRAWCRPVEA